MGKITEALRWRKIASAALYRRAESPLDREKRIADMRENCTNGELLRELLRRCKSTPGFKALMVRSTGEISVRHNENETGFSEALVGIGEGLPARIIISTEELRNLGV